MFRGYTMLLAVPVSSFGGYDKYMSIGVFDVKRYETQRPYRVICNINFVVATLINYVVSLKKFGNARFWQAIKSLKNKKVL